ncbi:MAG TPA: hypothetical protein VLH83_04420, partial [Chthoniobacterales bacterium]|nr:hypothetical protein [Chthoniobacterales bacterium]
DRERQIADGVGVAVRFAEALEKNGRFAHRINADAIASTVVATAALWDSFFKWKTKLVKHCASPPSKNPCACSHFFV